MSTISLFVQVQGQPGLIELEVAAALAADELKDELTRAGVEVAPEAFIFIDEVEEHVDHKKHEPVHGLKHGGRVHVCHCHRIKTTVHFQARTIERHFAPGTRVRTVKAWAAREFKVSEVDAAEHVLQLCNSTDRPAGDTPLHDLTKHRHCEVCFDFVPEKRVEG